MIGDYGKAACWISPCELGHPLTIGPDQRIGQQHVRGPTASHHLGLGRGGALVFVDAGIELEPNDFTRLMGLHVGPKALGAPGQSQGVADVALDQLLVEEEGGCEDRRGIVKAIRCVHGVLRVVAPDLPTGESQPSVYVPAAGEEGEKRTGLGALPLARVRFPCVRTDSSECPVPLRSAQRATLAFPKQLRLYI